MFFEHSVHTVRQNMITEKLNKKNSKDAVHKKRQNKNWHEWLNTAEKNQ